MELPGHMGLQVTTPVARTTLKMEMVIVWRVLSSCSPSHPPILLVFSILRSNYKSIPSST